MAEIIKVDLERLILNLKADEALQEIIINSIEFKELESGIDSENMFYYIIASSFLEEEVNQLIKQNSIKEFFENEISWPLIKETLENKLETYCSFSYLSDDFYKRLIYNVKYSTINKFFEENYKHFLPIYDYKEIEEQIKTKIFIEAFMKEFDRFSTIIFDLSRLTDIDSIPEEYLNYLAQLLGYQKGLDNSLFTFITFREFIKNIIEIYQIKGTNYSAELFLSLLGFSLEIKEMWFDKRKYYDLSSNAAKENFLNYLTPIPPYLVTINNISVNKEDMKYSKSIYTIEKKLESGLTIEQILGIEKSINMLEPYDYFKTNYIKFNVRAEDKVKSITSDITFLINSYLNFLIPIFIDKKVNFIPSLGAGDGSKKWILEFKDDKAVYLSSYQYITGYYLDTSNILEGYNEALGSTHFEKLTSLGISERDVFFPIIGQENNNELASEKRDSELDNFLYDKIILANNFSLLKGGELRNANEFSESHNKSLIQSMNFSNNTIVINQKGAEGWAPFGSLEGFSKIQVVSEKLINRGVYTISEVTITDDTYIISVEENFPSSQSSGGYIIPFIEEAWKYKNFILSSMQDIVSIKENNEVLGSGEYYAV